MLKMWKIKPQEEKMSQAARDTMVGGVRSSIQEILDWMVDNYKSLPEECFKIDYLNSMFNIEVDRGGISGISIFYDWSCGVILLFVSGTTIDLSSDESKSVKEFVVSVYKHFRGVEESLKREKQEEALYNLVENLRS